MAQALKKDKKPHALDELVSRVGKLNPKLLESVLGDTSNDELVEAGASIATARLVTDGVRLYGEALDFFDDASGVQKRHLRGVSRSLLAVAVHHLDALRIFEAGAAEKSQGKIAQRIAVDESVRAATSNAVAIRDQAFDALRDAAGRDKKLRAQVEAAFGTADDPEAPTVATPRARGWSRSPRAASSIATARSPPPKLHPRRMPRRRPDQVETALSPGKTEVPRRQDRPARRQDRPLIQQDNAMSGKTDTSRMPPDISLAKTHLSLAKTDPAPTRTEASGARTMPWSLLDVFQRAAIMGR